MNKLSGREFMDYYKIGQRIRKVRKAQGLSQEQLAERVGISVTHMSHIETGNTKLSLAVFVRLARSLDIQTDDLLQDLKSGKTVAENTIMDVLETCTTQQIRIIADVVKAAKTAMDKYGDSSK